MVKDPKNFDILDAIKQTVKTTFEELHVITKDDLKYLPSKEEYFDREDKMMKKLEKIEEEVTILADHSRNHTDRIEALENIHPHGRHLASV